ncbi:lipoyl(octanoyl) transferase LipB [Indioceanicola profundi]|uniref:lipoyl(octanoyl) transferase LipB n=1 Tax=Indioceanicola profundi TaxID=2220096 RepID=UPI000E6AD699|nr:lipoyl(octanoyl) transferase LipB [Indioceanicola profundi]
MSSIEWRISERLVEYPEALSFMENRVADIRAGAAPETIWLLEHPPLYTAGTSAKDGDLLTPQRFPVFQAGRGGQYTYHGPGQRIGYVMLDVQARGGDLHDFVWRLEEWLIRTLAQFAVKGERRCGRVGVWVDMAAHGQPGVENKIAAIGVRVRRGVSFHGVSLNVEPDLDHFGGIVPCGIREHGVTSLAALGNIVTMAEVDAAMKEAFREVFLEDAALRPACA